MVKKNVSLMDFNSNPNIGIYMFVNDKFCLLGQKVNDKKKKEIESVLNVPVYNLTIIGTELIGLFVAGNNEIIAIPEVFEKEFDELNKICKKHDVELIQINEVKNTFGNNVLFGDEEILINASYSKEFISQLETKTKLPIVKISSKDFETVGSTVVYLNSKYFFSQEYEENDVKEILNKIAGLGTVNQGSSYISSGVVGNSFGIIIGSQSSTIEIQNLVENLNYI